MKVFIDNEYKCHSTNDGSLREIETDFFDGKCREFIEGYRFVPTGETWTRSDGEVFRGEMVSPWRDYPLLREFQEQYEEMLAQQSDMKQALEILEVSE